MSWTIEGTAANHETMTTKLNQVGSKDKWVCAIYINIYIYLSLSLISAQCGCTAPTKSTDYVKHLSFIDFNREQGFQYLPIPGGRSTSIWVDLEQYSHTKNCASAAVLQMYEQELNHLVLSAEGKGGRMIWHALSSGGPQNPQDCQLFAFATHV